MRKQRSTAPRKVQPRTISPFFAQQIEEPLERADRSAVEGVVEVQRTVKRKPHVPWSNDAPLNRAEKLLCPLRERDVDLPSISHDRTDPPNEPKPLESPHHLADGSCGDSQFASQIALSDELEGVPLDGKEHREPRRSNSKRLEKPALKCDGREISTVQGEQDGVHARPKSTRHANPTPPPTFFWDPPKPP